MPAAKSPMPDIDLPAGCHLHDADGIPLVVDDTGEPISAMVAGKPVPFAEFKKNLDKHYKAAGLKAPEKKDFGVTGAAASAGTEPTPEELKAKRERLKAVLDARLEARGIDHAALLEKAGPGHFLDLGGDDPRVVEDKTGEVKFWVVDGELVTEPPARRGLDDE